MGTKASVAMDAPLRRDGDPVALCGVFPRGDPLGDAREPGDLGDRVFRRRAEPGREPPVRGRGVNDTRDTEMPRLKSIASTFLGMLQLANFSSSSLRPRRARCADIVLVRVAETLGQRCKSPFVFQNVWSVP